MSKHTPEQMKPVGDWKIGDGTIPMFAHFTQIVWNFENGNEFILASFNGNFEDLARDAAARAVACRNALAGIDDPAAYLTTLRSQVAALTTERDEAAKPWADDVPLAGPSRPKNDGSIDYLIGYLLTVRKRFGSTCITCDLQWGSEALWIAHREREELKTLTAERDESKALLFARCQEIVSLINQRDAMVEALERIEEYWKASENESDACHAVVDIARSALALIKHD